MDSYRSEPGGHGSLADFLSRTRDTGQAGRQCRNASDAALDPARRPASKGRRPARRPGATHPAGPERRAAHLSRPSPASRPRKRGSSRRPRRRCSVTGSRRAFACSPTAGACLCGRRASPSGRWRASPCSTIRACTSKALAPNCTARTTCSRRGRVSDSAPGARCRCTPPRCRVGSCGRERSSGLRGTIDRRGAPPELTTFPQRPLQAAVGGSRAAISTTVD